MNRKSPLQLSTLAAAVAIAALAACTSRSDMSNGTDTEPSSKSVVAEETIPSPEPASEKKVPATERTWEETYATLLKKYVTPTGVRYSAWKNNPADLSELKSVVDSIASKPASGSEKARLAYYLNAYNAWILNNVLADYPTKGVGGGNALGRSAFFGGDRITVGGKKTSFNALENEIIRKQFSEPRIHFALNCASAGCPPLQNSPFRASTLDADLTRLATAFVDGNPEGVRITSDGTYSLSEIFTWFKDDFGDVPTFINRFRTEPIPADAKITSHDYDWSLNEAK